MVQKAREDFNAWCDQFGVKASDKNLVWAAFFAGWCAAQLRVKVAIE